MKTKLSLSYPFVYGAVMTVFVTGLAALVLSQPAAATVKFATDTGKGCGDCHVNAAGGGKLTVLGEKFKANGNKLP